MYWPANTVLRGRLGRREITDEVVSSSDVEAMVRKVEVYPDPSISVATARVNIDVTLKDGRVLAEAYFPAKGATDNPLTRTELTEKFNECAEWGGVSRINAARRVELLLSLERMRSIKALMPHVVAERAGNGRRACP